VISHEDVEVSSMSVTAVRPETEDMRRLRLLEADEGVRTGGYYHVAKVYLRKLLPPTAMAPDFYVGDERITKYNGFRGGIYFEVHDPRFLERNAGKPLRFTIDGTTFHDTGVTLPRSEPPPTSAPGVPAGLAREVRDKEVVDPAALPTKAEVLRR